MRRHCGPAGQHRSGCLGEQLRDDRLRGRAGVGRLSGEHLVQHRAEGVDIAPAVELTVGGGLLGAHVLRRAQRKSGLGETPAAGLGHRARDSEIGHHRRPMSDQDVFRLDVAVNDATPMGIRQGTRRLGRDADGVVDRELSLALQPVAQRLPVDERHHVKEKAVRFAGVVQGQNVRVLQSRRHADLLEKPVGADHRRELGAEHLEGHLAVVPQVAGEVDRGHAPLADLALDGVPVGEGGRQAAGNGLGHRRLWGESSPQGYAEARGIPSGDPGGS